MELHELEVYRLASEISDDAWIMYARMDWHTKKIIGDQFISAVDSISANIAEGFGRFHYLDKNKFHYNACGSLFEVLDWVEKLHKRSLMTEQEYEKMRHALTNLAIKLNNYIRSISTLKNN